MYRKMYGKHRNHNRQNKITSRERTLRQKTDSLDSYIKKQRVRRYGCRRVVTRSYRRDMAMWEDQLDGENRERLVELKKEEEEKENNLRVDEDTLDTLKKDGVLLVESVNQNIEFNTENHHTDLFECVERDEDPQLVVRRGQEFNLTLTFQRPWNSADDDMYLIFTLGEEPNPRKGTYVRMKLEEGKDTHYKDGEEKTWGARIDGKEGNNLTIAVFSPPTAIIGEWEYTIRTVTLRGEGGKEEYENESSDVIILFNPWCKDDQVYMETEEDLKEYINNEHGLVFNGSYRSIGSKPWHYGQFKKGVLDASLHLLRKANGYSVSAQMGDPVYVARALSRILNDCDDNGVLQGRWDGDYNEGIRPTAWKGSAPIIEKYMETKKPVKYGQCWVFSHLFTTVARALGLPMRSVTNFSSAHDTDLTMTIDKYIDEDGDEIEYKSGDSVWNFHVWNEAWILRPDLDTLFGAEGKYDGWHAVDATPQELSDSVFQCGPAPLTAIKSGEVHVGYDTKFIFAEVNAECCNWKDGDPPVLISKNTKRVGKKMSTKLPNGSTVGRYRGFDKGVRLDVTGLYKHDEGSAGERAAVEKATRQGKYGEILFDDKTGVSLEILEEQEPYEVGKDLKVKVEVKNSSMETRSVRLRTTVRPTNYWGGILGKEKIASKLFSEEKIEPEEKKVYELNVDADEYLRLCDEQLSMRIFALGTVRGFDDPVFSSDDIVIKLPEIECDGPFGNVQPEEEFTVEITFTNPLKNKAMTGCELSVEGTLIVTEGQDFEEKYGIFTKKIDDINPEEKKTMEIKVRPSVKPKKSRDRELEVGLASNELPDMEGVFDAEISR